MNRYRLTFNPAAGRVGWYGEILDDRNTVLRTSTDDRGPLSKLGLEALGPGDEAAAVQKIEALEPMLRILTADQQTRQDAVDARKQATTAARAAVVADAERDRIQAEVDARIDAAKRAAEEAHAVADRANERANALEGLAVIDPDLDAVTREPLGNEPGDRAVDPINQAAAELDAALVEDLDPLSPHRGKHGRKMPAHPHR